MMRISLILALLLLLPRGACGKGPGDGGLYKVAITRDVPPEAFVYNWRDAVLMKSLIDIWRTDESRRHEIEAYIQSAMIRVAPKAHGRHPNGLAAGVGLAFLKEARLSTDVTDAALARVHSHYLEITRTPEGGCSHRPGRLELWDDTLYMLDIFLIECYRASGELAYVGELADEVLAHAKHLCDPASGLWYHGWSATNVPGDDACSQSGWNANPGQRNSEFWGRGNGWVAMAMADLLEFLPREDPRYPGVKDIFVQMMATLSRLQDKSTGLWYQLPSRPGETGNFLESSCSAMFGYAAEKGFQTGVLPRRYHKVALRALRGLRKRIVSPGTAEAFLDGVCAGTCIGDKEYYYARKRVAGSGETYATGVFLMLENLLNQ